MLSEEKDEEMEKIEKMEKCRAEIKCLVNKKKIYFTRRCNKSIELALDASLKGNNMQDCEKKVILIQEEGGWITYSKYARKHKLDILKLKMNKGKLIKDHLVKALHQYKGNSILIMHSLPGYSYDEKMDEIYVLVKESGATLINDCCGSIGTDSAKIGDIIVCSFGEDKPLSAGGGGFIAADDFTSSYNSIVSELSNEEKKAAEKIDFQKLDMTISFLQERRSGWKSITEKTKKELMSKGFNVLNIESEGINVLVNFSDEEEKERLINYCKDKGIEYTECPRYIRTLEKALSLEIKRI